MTKIQLSIMEYYPGCDAALQPLLEEFQRRYRIKVQLTTIPWSRGWHTIADMAIYSHGADVSEIGSTWAYSLASMNALRFFDPTEFSLMDRDQAFMEPLLSSCCDMDTGQVWAVPWLADPQILLYRRDFLEQAGINDAESALATFPAFQHTLQQLQAHGFSHPLGLNTQSVAPLLHEAARWIWGMGGDFVNATRSRVAFVQPEALAGLEMYFGLAPFILPHFTRDLSIALLEGHVAMIFCTRSTFNTLAQSHLAAELATHVGPGVPYVGGTHLVIWRHARQPEAAVKLIRFLLQATGGLEGSPHARLFAARHPTLEALESSPQPEHHSFGRAFQTGRPFPPTRLWGRIEQSLTQSLAFLWSQLTAGSGTAFSTLLNAELQQLADSLNAALAC